MDNNAIDLLEQYHWPGNIRELKNILARLVVQVDDDPIGAECVRALLGHISISDKTPRKNRLADMEKQAVLRAYDRHNGNISAVARQLDPQHRVASINRKIAPNLSTMDVPRAAFSGSIESRG